jgi:hypothetical protein
MGSFEEYSDLGSTGFGGSSVSVEPEKEFFKSLYISGMDRLNHAKITEEAGLLQIRGHEYNLTTVNMVITHVKSHLQMDTADGNGWPECFCYQDPNQKPWTGTTGRVCPKTSAARQAHEFCGRCKSQIIVAGILCDAKGKPVVNKETGKPVFIFIRAKGIKYKPVSEFLSTLSEREFKEPLFTPVTDQSKIFEKRVCNQKRVVTEVTIGTTKTKYGMKNIFSLKVISEIPVKAALSILKISKEALPNFDEKFDLTKKIIGEDSPAEIAKKHEESKIFDEAIANNFGLSESGDTEDSFNFEDISV